jgi:twitching motility protein PilI
MDMTMGPFEVLVDYERRSLAHVAGLPEQLDAPGLWRGVGYRIGSRRLASEFGEVREILTVPQITPVPGTQPWMLGVANVRGQLLPIVDMKQFLEGERTVLHESLRVLLVRQGGGDVAVLVD